MRTIPMPAALTAKLRSIVPRKTLSAVEPFWQPDVLADPRKNRNTSHTARPAERIRAPRGGDMSAAQVRRALLLFQHDPQYGGERRVTIKGLADWCGFERTTVYDAMHGRMSDRTREKLADAIWLIEQGWLWWRRVGGRYGNRFEVVYRPRWPLNMQQAALLLAEDYDPMANCSRCNGHQYAAVEIAGREHRACAQCAPRETWAAFGGRPMQADSF